MTGEIKEFEGPNARNGSGVTEKGTDTDSVWMSVSLHSPSHQSLTTFGNRLQKTLRSISSTPLFFVVVHLSIPQFVTIVTHQVFVTDKLPVQMESGRGRC